MKIRVEKDASAVGVAGADLVSAATGGILPHRSGFLSACVAFMLTGAYDQSSFSASSRKASGTERVNPSATEA